jgi:NYN domain-containing protein
MAGHLTGVGRAKNCAWFIDWDNIHIELGKKLQHMLPVPDIGDLVLKILKKVRARLETESDARLLIGRAYGTWEGLTEIPDSLALMSFKPEYVLTHPRYNSADLELSLDAQEVLIRRPDIEHYVIAGGDRDYIPLVRRVLESGRSVSIIALESGMSGDLREIVGESNFISVDPVVLEILSLESFPVKSEHETILEGVVPTPIVAINAPAIDMGLTQDELLALKLIVTSMTSQGQWEIPIVPFYKDYMNDAFATHTDEQRKAIVSSLNKKGLIDLKVKPGPYGGITSSTGTYYLSLSVNQYDTRIQDLARRSLTAEK